MPGSVGYVNQDSGKRYDCGQHERESFHMPCTFPAFHLANRWLVTQIRNRRLDEALALVSRSLSPFREHVNEIRPMRAIRTESLGDGQLDDGTADTLVSILRHFQIQWQLEGICCQ